MAGLVVRKSNPLAAVGNLSADKIKLIKDTVCKGSTDNELALFLHACNHSGLDPIRRQIYAVFRFDRSLNRKAMTIQTGIDGYRSISDRTGNYAPGAKPAFKYDGDGKLISATAYIKKWAHGEWQAVEADALWEEYVQTGADGKPQGKWQTMPHTMLAKCAEAICHRKAFPNAQAGILTEEEMEQADSMAAPDRRYAPSRTEEIKPADATVLEPAKEVPQAVGAGGDGNGVADAAPVKSSPVADSPAPTAAPPPSACISDPQRRRLWAILQKGSTGPDDKKAREATLKDWMQANCGHAHTEQISRNDYEKVCEEAARIAGGA